MDAKVVLVQHIFCSMTVNVKSLQEVFSSDMQNLPSVILENQVNTVDVLNVLFFFGPER